MAARESARDEGKYSSLEIWNELARSLFKAEKMASEEERTTGTTC